MIEVAESQEEIFAILAHEIGHAELRHSMRQILQSSFVALAATMITAMQPHLVLLRQGCLPFWHGLNIRVILRQRQMNLLLSFSNVMIYLPKHLPALWNDLIKRAKRADSRHCFVGYYAETDI